MPNVEFNLFVWGWILVALVAFVVLLFISAPYGRYVRKGWGPTMNSRVGWCLMEGTSLVVFSVCFFSGPAGKSWIYYLLATLWILHYLNRAIVYPLRQADAAKAMPMAIVAMGSAFNCINGFLNGYYLGHLASYDADWAGSPWFIAGGLCFIAGAGLNVWSDERLLRLKRAGNGYQNPRGGMFEWVSCPNYLGEIIEWTGFALMTFSLPALSFLIWTCANLVPRALAHHRWYRDRFGDVPVGRAALIPGFSR